MTVERRRTEFPALEARKEFLEHEYYNASKMAADAIFAGKPDNAIQQWLAGIVAELDELRYVLRVLTAPDGRIEISGRAVLWIGLLLTAVFVAQVAILLSVGT